MEPIETFEHAGLTVEIHHDDATDNDPREWSHVGHMVCWHRRTNLGDETIRTEDFESEQALIESFNARIVLPLYLYQHSGMTMRTRPFSDPWDSGQVGFIYATAESIREAFMTKRITKEIEARAREALESEVKVYDSFLRGEVYGYIVKNADGEDLGSMGDSCWGFVGDMEYCIEAAKEAAEACAEEVSAEQGEAAEWAARDTVTVLS